MKVMAFLIALLVSFCGKDENKWIGVKGGGGGGSLVCYFCDRILSYNEGLISKKVFREPA